VRWRWRIVIAVATVAIVLFVLWARRFIAIDECLDSGGAWNYRGGVCDR
jgi:hypothetical protein